MESSVGDALHFPALIGGSDPVKLSSKPFSERPAASGVNGGVNRISLVVSNLEATVSADSGN
jgi:hypothetical protein